jgi:hypothetical protein
MRIVFTHFPVKFLKGAQGEGKPALTCKFNELPDFLEAIDHLLKEVDDNWSGLIENHMPFVMETTNE